jgi:uncharacterized protein (TIGR02569 family)
MNSAIPSQVIDLFGISSEARLLTGGQGTAIQYDNIVVKPCHDPAEWTGLAALLSRLRPVGYRLAKPKQALDGRWVVDGWMATHLVEGTPGYKGREAEALSACRCFHQDLADVYGLSDCPDWLGSVSNVWRKANQLAWGELPLSKELGDDVYEYLTPIVKSIRPIDLPNQITHGDPGSDNVLFALNQAPALIDIAPYWRPAGYAIAMMLADGIAWEGSKLSTLALARDEPYIGQLLLHAVMFRLTVSVLSSGPASLAKQYSAYESVTQWAMAHMD